MPYTATVKKEEPGVYLVKTNAPDSVLSEISVYIFTEWVKFALGNSSLGGRSLMNPTGKYASSIRVEKKDLHNIAIIADPSIAPEANYLEFGHKAYDMKQKFKGRVFPMHRPGGTPFLKGTKVPGYILTASRSGDFAGFAMVGNKGWVIPAMKAYHPTMFLARMAANKLHSN